VLQNKYVAELNGFPELYNCFANSSYYKRNYDRLNNELLSNDLSKLGNVPIFFYRILQFLDQIRNPQTSVSVLINKKIYSTVTFKKLKELIEILQKIKGETFGEIIKEIFKVYDNRNESHIKQIMHRLMKLDRYTYQEFLNFILDELYLNIGGQRLNDFKQSLIQLFEEENFTEKENKKNELINAEIKKFVEKSYFSVVEKNEIDEFKMKLSEFIDKIKVFDAPNKIKNEFKAKLDKLFHDEIYSQINVDEVEISKLKISELLDIHMNQWELWYKFINNNQDADTIFHTYHGTKGAEFENVIIIMENDFGRLDREKFSSFFKNYSLKEELDGKEKHKYNNTRNLLYVSCSRAIKNLRILYLNDISDFRKGVEMIFGTPIPYV